jgi:hypothetical protein
MSDVREEFSSRQRHQIIDIRWLGQTLLLTVGNDYDANGEALAEEFSDTITAYAPGTPGYSVRIVTLEPEFDVAVTQGPLLEYNRVVDCPPNT